MTLYLVGLNEFDAEYGFIWDDYTSAKEHKRDQDDPYGDDYKIYSVGATIDFSTMELITD